MTDSSETARIWQLEGSSAEAYERYLVPMMFAPWAEQLVERAGVRSGERVLDVACGTGIVARYAATRVGPRGSVVGLDVSESMLEAAAAAASGAGAGVEWKAASATEMPVEDEAFDVVFCQQALQFFRDRPRALREMHRVLVPQGRLAISVWRPLTHNPAYVVVVDALERHVGREAAEMMRSPFPDWSLEDLRSLLEDAGFREVQITIGIGTMRYPSVQEFLRREAASSPLATPLAGIAEEKRRKLIDKVGDALSTYHDDEGIVFPMETYLASARR